LRLAWAVCLNALCGGGGVKEEELHRRAGEFGALARALGLAQGTGGAAGVWRAAVACVEGALGADRSADGIAWAVVASELAGSGEGGEAGALAATHALLLVAVAIGAAPKKGGKTVAADALVRLCREWTQALSTTGATGATAVEAAVRAGRAEAANELASRLAHCVALAKGR